MDHDEYAMSLGKIVGNFHALELLIRVFLCEDKKEHYELPAAGASEVLLSHLTNYDSMDKLICKYNASLDTNDEKKYRVDPKIVRIRDAIAHGRPVSATGGFPITLYKFGKRSVAGKVSVEFSEVLDDAWLKDAMQKIFSSIESVRSCAQSRGYNEAIAG